MPVGGEKRAVICGLDVDRPFPLGLGLVVEPAGYQVDLPPRAPVLPWEKDNFLTGLATPVP